MKAEEVMKILGISKSTLYNYRNNNTLKCIRLDNGYYEYDPEVVIALRKKDTRYNVIYTRVSTYNQKESLETQTTQLQNYCDSNNIKIETTYSEIASGLDLDRKELGNLLNDVFNFKIKNIYISNKDRISRLGFKVLESIISKFNTKIIVVNDIINEVNDNEMLEELISLIHVFSMSMYSNRNKSKLKISKKDIEHYLNKEDTLE